MKLETPRLVIERLRISDAAFILELLNDATFIASIGDKQVRTEAEAIQYLESVPIRSYREHGFGSYAVRVKSSGALIGTCGLIKRADLPDVDIGYGFLPAARGKGYALEAAQRVMLHAAEEFGLRRVVALISSHNQASIALAEKLGLRYERLYQMSLDEEPLCLYGGTIV